MLIQSGMSFLHSKPMSFEDRNNQSRFCRKVVMNTSFSDLNRFGDVSIAKGGKPALHQESMGYIHDPFCGFTMHTTSDYLLVGLVAKLLKFLCRCVSTTIETRKPTDNAVIGSALDREDSVEVHRPGRLYTAHERGAAYSRFAV